MKIILGSRSPRRLDILRTAVNPQLPIEVMPADIDEKTIRFPHPSSLTMAIACAKCEALIYRFPGDGVIVTADTVAVCDGKIREKPENADELRRFIESYRVHPVTAVTSVYVYRKSSRWSGSATDTATAIFRPFTDEHIDRIVGVRDFFGSAGGFLIEHPLMRDHLIGVDGDPETIQGLPGRLVKLLIEDALKT